MTVSAWLHHKLSYAGGNFRTLEIGFAFLDRRLHVWHDCRMSALSLAEECRERHLVLRKYTPKSGRLMSFLADISMNNGSPGCCCFEAAKTEYSTRLLDDYVLKSQGCLVLPVLGSAARDMEVSAKTL